MKEALLIVAIAFTWFIIHQLAAAVAGIISAIANKSSFTDRPLLAWIVIWLLDGFLWTMYITC